MYGAILGDIIGSPYEFDRGNKSKNFPLFKEDSKFTDDTVMTIAVADALMNIDTKDEEIIKSRLINSLKKWGKRYPGKGYGVRFNNWLNSENMGPYNSFGNGSAMRVSSVGWLYDSLDETRKVARLSAEITHNHPEGIKGAEAVASIIYLLRNGKSKEDIKEFTIKEFGYDLNRTLDDIRPNYHHVESIIKTVPEAIIAFLEGNSFIDVIRNAVSLGGDCDTLTCIAGSMAEAYYKIPKTLIEECKNRVPEDMKIVLEKFDGLRGMDEYFEEDISSNVIIEDAIKTYYKKGDRDSFTYVIYSIIKRMNEEGSFIIPVIPPSNIFKMMDFKNMKIGDTFTINEDTYFKLQHIEIDNKYYLAAFTRYIECEKGEGSSNVNISIYETLKELTYIKEDGIVINPWDRAFIITKELANIILNLYESKEDKKDENN